MENESDELQKWLERRERLWDEYNSGLDNVDDKETDDEY